MVRDVFVFRNESTDNLPQSRLKLAKLFGRYIKVVVIYLELTGGWHLCNYDI
jgi:hypothetical protein